MKRAIEVFCELYVRDLRSNVRWFVEDLGFLCERVEDEFAELVAGTTRILLNSQILSEFETANPIREISIDTPRGAGVEIGIMVIDLDATYAAVCENPALTPTGPPASVPWGGRDFRMIHPDGFYIRIAST